jgi:hypothetical protein
VEGDPIKIATNTPSRSHNSRKRKHGEDQKSTKRRKSSEEGPSAQDLDEKNSPGKQEKSKTQRSAAADELKKRAKTSRENPLHKRPDVHGSTVTCALQSVQDAKVTVVDRDGPLPESAEDE